jgi:hypothetical protein
MRKHYENINNNKRKREIMENITVNGINLFEFSIEELENIKDTVQHMIDEKYAEENSESEQIT